MINWQYKIFKDNVHGYIKVPLLLVENIIDTDIFQRLRYIEQTGMRILYPSARHDRFIHSLGTYHLGVKAFEAFRYNVNNYYSKNQDSNRNHYYIKDNQIENDNFWDKLGILFSIACILHDCGHSPFSHTFEYLYDIEKANDQPDLSALNKELLDFYNTTSFLSDFHNGVGKEHERMSALLIKSYFKPNIQKILEGFSFKFEEEDLEFIARCIIGCKYKIIDSKENQMKNCIIQLLNSSSIDVDGLDYIIRDSKLSGIDTANIDVDRLISSLTIVETTHFINCKLIREKIDSAILKGDFTGVVNGNIFGSINVKNFSGEISGFLNLQGKAILKTNATINNGTAYVGNALYKDKIPTPEGITDINLNLNITQKLSIENADLICASTQNAYFSSCSANSKLEFGPLYFKGSLDGTFNGYVLGYYTGENTHHEINIAFHKSSLGILQNVLSARNYEYYWIYGHHKVVYYSNFLLIHVFRESAKFIMGSDKKIDTDTLLTKFLAMTKIETYKKYIFFRNCDSDLLAFFKECHIKNLSSKKINENLKELYEEFFSRKYKKSVWKSFAEFNYFFRELSVEEKNALFSVVQDNSKSKNSSTKYGFFNDEWEEIFNQYGMRKVVWVNAEVTTKELDQDKTFILLKDYSMRIKDVLPSEYNQPLTKIKNFYLYYSSGCALSKDNLESLITFLKEKAKNKLLK